MAEILTGEAAAQAWLGECVLTVGAFDGVHIGHQAILQETVEAGSRLRLPAHAVTFDPHPTGLTGGSRPQYLTGLEERISLIASAGLAAIRVVPFTADFASTPAEEYVERVLVGRFGARAVVVGPSHAFGSKGRGDVALLTTLGDRFGFSVRVVEPCQYDGEVVSSSRIRDAVAAGEVGRARAMLGRPYLLRGTVVTGEGRGSRLGYPTANCLVAPDRVVAAPGVYAAVAKVPSGVYAAGLHIGPAPTFDREATVIEAHLLGFSGDLVGQPMALAFLERLRGVSRFASGEELRAAMRADLEATRRYAEREKWASWPW